MNPTTYRSPIQCHRVLPSHQEATAEQGPKGHISYLDDEDKTQWGSWPFPLTWCVCTHLFPVVKLRLCTVQTLLLDFA